MIWLNIYDFRIYDFINAFFKSGCISINFANCSFFAQSNEKSANKKYFDRYLINAGGIVTTWNEPTLSADPFWFVLIILSVPAKGGQGWRKIRQELENWFRKNDKYLKINQR